MMAIRCFFAVLLTFCLHAPAQAQRALVWQPDTTLRMGGAAPFNYVTIEDVRRDKTSIGWLKTGALNRYAAW